MALKVSRLILPLDLIISPAPVVQSGQCKLQTLVGSMVKTGGKPQMIGLLVMTDMKKEVDVLMMLPMRRRLSDRNNPAKRISFK